MSAVGVAAAPVGGAKTGEEPVVAQHAHRNAGRAVDGGDNRLCVTHDRLGVLADQQSGLEVIGREERIGRIHRLGRRIERDDKHARVARLLNGRHDRLGVTRRDQDALHPGGHHVFDRGDLTGVVSVECPGRRQQFGARGIRRRLRAFLHLDEERVRLGLGDQPDDDFIILCRRGLHGGKERKRTHQERERQQDAGLAGVPKPALGSEATAHRLSPFGL